MKRKLKHSAVILSISFFIFCFTSCSFVLNAALIPFAPKFTPQIEMSDEGAKIYYSLSFEKNVSKDDSQDWSRDYAYYIWRSTENPYNNFKLIKRVYISSAVGVYEGYYTTDEGKKYKKYDFTLPEDAPDIPYEEKLNLSYSSDGYIVDKKALDCTCYYRVSKITLSSSHYVSEESNSESLTYSLSDKTSGWLSLGGSN